MGRLSLLIVLSLVLSVLVGCGKPPEHRSDPNGAPVTAPTTPPLTGPAAEAAENLPQGGGVQSGVSSGDGGVATPSQENLPGQ